MTGRLYYHDSYLRAFTATVVGTTDDGVCVFLDQTALYPTSGGQPHDTGTLGGIPVVDVRDDPQGIAHVLAAPLPAGTSSVQGTVNWDRRFDHMQQHSGQHLLSAVLADMGRETVSVHFGDASNTVDLAGDAAIDLAAVEDRANLEVTANRPVTVTLEDAATATGLRKPSGRTGPLRIVTIDGLDRSACGGTHVRATGEIGPILVRRIDRTRGRARIEFLCGLRAVRRARADLAALSAVATGFSTTLDQAPLLAAEAREQLAGLRKDCEHQASELARRDAVARYEASSPDTRGRRLVVERRDSGGVLALRPLALAVAALDGAVFIGTCAEPATILVASSAASGLDAGALLKAALAAHGGRGGGSPRLAQGSVDSREALAQVVDAVIAG